MTTSMLHSMEKAAGSGNGKHSRELAVTRLADVVPEPIEWLWPRRIPRGKLTLLVGDPGTGKSFISLAIAAAITRGNALPDGEPQPAQNVLIWNGEDGTGDTIRPRAAATGVALERCWVIDGELRDDGQSSPFSLLSIDVLGQYVARVGNVGVVVVDPIAALLAGVDAHRDTEVRSALQPLADFARDSGVAVLAIMHLNKREAESALYRVGGSIAFVGLARSVLLAATDPENGRRAIAPLKCNLAAKPTPIEYRIDDEGRFWWGSSAEDLSAERLLRSVRPQSYGGARNDAERFLRETLEDGPVLARDVELLAEGKGIAPATLKRARRSVGVISNKTRDGWTLCLPS